ncbi:MAG TPA: hypothetical protein VFN53_05915 [Acidobacteriaceae bacterium]|nr:hypothetical protein [Acidobacteriaceae bacterium]
MMFHSQSTVRTVELAAWDFDNYKYRTPILDADKCAEAREFVLQRNLDTSASALREEETRLLQEELNQQKIRPDLQREMCGLDWSLGVVDLRRLLAFQRRLYFRSSPASPPVPVQQDRKALMAISFPCVRPQPVEVTRDEHREIITMQSTSPNLHLRVSDASAAPVAVYAGSPFFEVAQYAHRWFLRDGYHRAYDLLTAGIVQLPAVIVRARTLAELGAVGAQFFSESILLSGHPPLVSDFLNPKMTVQYESPCILKTLRITMEETIVPQPF